MVAGIMTHYRPEGVVCPIATPLNDDETLDENAYRVLLDHMLPHVDGILVLGTTGEFALLKPDVARRAVEVTLEHVNGRKAVYVGIGDTGTARVLDMLDFTNDAKPDFVVVCSPFYYAVNDKDALKRHYITAADLSEVPVLVYNIPQNTHVNIPPDIIARLSEHPNIVGLKDSWGDFVQYQEFVALRNETFSVLMGPEQLAAASLWVGGDGIVSALANIHPEPLQQLVSAVREGDRQRALDLQRQITRLSHIFQHGTVSGALKVALTAMGIGNERQASPLPSSTESQKQAIYAILREFELVK